MTRNFTPFGKGRTIRKVMGGGGGTKIKFEQGKQKKNSGTRNVRKKNSCRDFSIGKIISWCVYYIYITRNYYRKESAASPRLPVEHP